MSSDTCRTGSFDGHAAALAETAVVTLGDVDDGTYELRLFASRTGDDGGLGRLTRYSVDNDVLDVEIADNTSDVASFTNVSPDSDNRLVTEVTASPDGTGRFAYLGALVLTKTGN